MPKTPAVRAGVEPAWVAEQRLAVNALEQPRAGRLRVGDVRFSVLVAPAGAAELGARGALATARANALCSGRIVCHAFKCGRGLGRGSARPFSKQTTTLNPASVHTLLRQGNVNLLRRGNGNQNDGSAKPEANE